MRNRAGSAVAFAVVALAAGSAWGQCNWVALPASSYSPCVGTQLSLSGSVESADAVHEWRRTSDGYVIATGANPTVAVSSVDQSGEYRCYATVPGPDGCMASSPAFTIAVRAPAVVTPSTSVTRGVCTGDELVLSVEATGPGPYSYQWYKGSSAVGDSASVSGSNTPTLTIHSTVVGNQGAYTCVVASNCGAVTSGTFNVTVSGPFSPVQAPTSLLLCDSSSATLSVVQSSLPSAVAYQWFRGGGPIVNGGRYAGASTATLSISPVAPEDLAQTFHCELSTPCERVETTPAIIARDTPMCGLAFDRVAAGLATPVYACAPRDDFNRLFIVQRGGVLRVLNLSTSTLETAPYLTISGVRTSGEDGFLGLAFHPRFSENGYFYVNYSNSDSDAAIVRYRALEPYGMSSAADPSSATIVAIIEQNGGIHNGGWIGFRPDDTEGHLYLSIGDGGGSANAQNADVHTGKILRIDVDGPDNVPGNGDDADPVAGTAYRVPSDNPFVGVDGRDEILALGVRNPWRCSFDRDTSDLYIGDVGAGYEEEITLLAADTPASPALNFGWPCIEGRRVSTSGLGCSTQPTNPTGPIFANRRNDGCAITGGFVYRGSLIPHLRGYYLFSDYCSGGLFALNVDNVQQGVISEPMPFSLGARMEAQGDAVGNIPAMGEDADGEVYVMDSSSLYRIVDLARVPADCNANGVDDVLDISRGVEGDCDGDGVPDSCDSCCPACPADFDQDGGVTGADISAFFAEYEQGNPCADTDLDGGVTGADIATFFMAYEAGGC